MSSTSGAPEIPDFLRAKSDLAVKKELRGILQSYHHYWDILAELLQNSRDAIESRRKMESENGVEPTAGKIHISVDATKRSVEVTDNGIGIPSDFVKEVLAPGGGSKSASDDQVGEKGVGLTYVAFSGDLFELSTKTESDSTSVTLTGAASWVHDDGTAVYPPKFELRDDSSTPNGFKNGTFTHIRIAGIPQQTSTDLFELSSESLKWVLRTRTAIGDTRKLVRNLKLPDIEVTYTWTSVNGDTLEGEVQVGYPDLHDAKALKIEDVNSNLVGKSDGAARKYLAGKVVYGTKEVGSENDEIRVFGVMLPGNKTPFEEIANANHIDLNDDDPNPLLQAGIFVVTKSMPTGVQIEPAARGAYPAYYKRCIFLVESDKIDFDLGRKSMHWRHKKRLQDAVADLFVQFEKVAKYQNPAESGPLPPTFETPAERKHRIKKMWEEVEGRHNLSWPGLAFGKFPTNQEAAVAALFHELLGSGKIKDIRPLAAGYSTQYDLLAHYTGGGQELQLVIEFKDRLESIISDFRDGIKSVDDIDLLVCWEVNEQKISDVGLTLTPTSAPAYDGVTHELSLPADFSNTAIPVIVLKSFYEKSITA